MRGKYVPPSTELTAFNCPHCGVLTTQFWSRAFAGLVGTESQTPSLWRSTDDLSVFDDMEVDDRRKMLEWIKKASSGYPFFDKVNDQSRNQAINVHFSNCYECRKISIWVHDNLIWPPSTEGTRSECGFARRRARRL